MVTLGVVEVRGLVTARSEQGVGNPEEGMGFAS